jgi:hypothetical protein
MGSQVRKILIILLVFSIAMGFLESAVVIYIREIYYPSGFDFPLVPIEPRIALTELFRELATLIMLFTIAFIAGKSFNQRLSYFLYCFAVWDIFYYVFLYLVLGWPSSLFTWDVLFLIPVTWVGPVIAPIIVSLTMIAIALVVLYGESKGKHIIFDWKIWGLLIAGGLFIFISFVWDYSSFVLDHYSFRELLNLPGDVFFDISLEYSPRQFNWYFFSTGELFLLLVIVRLYMIEYYRKV